MYGSAGEYRYDHPDGTALWVHRNPDKDGIWEAHAQHDHLNNGEFVTIVTGVGKKAAFEEAYRWMENYDSAQQTSYGEFGGFGGASL